jgi:hypothetical protein
MDNGSEMIDYSGELLVMFVQHFGDLYGKNMLVYNVHCLIHLPQDARQFGNLDKISAFPFENFLGKMKKLVRKPSQPLQQVIHRLAERAISAPVIDVGPRCRKDHFYGPIPSALARGSQFKEIHLPLGLVSTSQGNNCVQINDEVVLIKNIVVLDETEYVVYSRFRRSGDFFTYPLSSKDIGISLVAELHSVVDYTPVSDISMKMVLLPLLSQAGQANNRNYSYLALPLLHIQT